MKNCIHVLNAAMILLCIAAQSCSKGVFDTEEVQTDKTFRISPRIVVKDSWAATTRNTIGATDALFMCYLFDYEGKCLINRGDAMKLSEQTVFTDVRSAGKYSISCVTGWFVGEYPGTSSNNNISKETILTIPEPRDFCLGSTEFETNAEQFEYNVTINVDHIMAKVSFSISKVPSFVKAISITLPNQANQFKFDGTLLGNTKSQTLELTQESGSDGTNTWSVGETIVFPFSSNEGKMPIKVNVTTASGTNTYTTETDTPCGTGMRVAYVAAWELIYTHNTTIKTNPWTDEVIEGTFYLGKPSEGNE